MEEFVGMGECASLILGKESRDLVIMGDFTIMGEFNSLSLGRVSSGMDWAADPNSCGTHSIESLSKRTISSPISMLIRSKLLAAAEVCIVYSSRSFSNSSWIARKRGRGGARKVVAARMDVPLGDGETTLFSGTIEREGCPTPIAFSALPEIGTSMLEPRSSSGKDKFMLESTQDEQ
jgi:hypothetical protein